MQVVDVSSGWRVVRNAVDNPMLLADNGSQHDLSALKSLGHTLLVFFHRTISRRTEDLLHELRNRSSRKKKLLANALMHHWLAFGVQTQRAVRAYDVL